MVKVLDVQNAAAAEQHVKAMAEYEAQLAEAAAAWEAEKKKKKGKAKDEVHRGPCTLDLLQLAMPTCTHKAPTKACPCV